MNAKISERCKWYIAKTYQGKGDKRWEVGAICGCYYTCPNLDVTGYPCELIPAVREYEEGRSIKRSNETS